MMLVKWDGRRVETQLPTIRVHATLAYPVALHVHHPTVRDTAHRQWYAMLLYTCITCIAMVV